jgi:hypothetical protein
MVVSPLLRHIPKEMNFIINQPTSLVFGFDMPQTIRLVPASRKSIKTNLPTDRVLHPQVRKLPLQRLHHCFPDPMRLIIPLELVHLRVTCPLSNRRNIHHTIPELNKGAPLDWNIQVGDVFQHPADECLVLYLTDPFDKRGPRERDTHSKGYEAVFGKAEVEEGGHWDGVSTELPLLFGEVAATNIADGTFVAETAEEGVHLWRDRLDRGVSWASWRREGGWYRCGIVILEGG